jgi:Alpha-glutamyl/putrescinyl thymine pyrophosphorylase clade 3
VIKEKFKPRVAELQLRLEKFVKTFGELPGIGSSDNLECLLAQLIDSQRRIEYAFYLRDHNHDQSREVPWSGAFDPLAAAVLKNRRGRVSESWWLVFLATHFGKHEKDKWALTEAVYGKLREGDLWDWNATQPKVEEFRLWVAQHQTELRGNGQQKKRFSNHRKYESLDATSEAGLGSVVGSYVEWLEKNGEPINFVRAIHTRVGQNPETVFDQLYKSMDAVKRFGRLGKFDFLTMLGKLGIAPIEPGSAYLLESTGPKRGARLLFFGDPDFSKSDRELDDLFQKLDSVMGVGMQVLEDAICNWQKSPSQHIHFRG